MNWLDRKLCKFPRWRKLRGLPEPRPLSPVEVQMLKMFADNMSHALKLSAAIHKDYQDSWEPGKRIKVRRPALYSQKAEGARHDA